jgi:radical SAM superfamily enzyme YgiQ (UPF0313 family)
MKILLVQPKRLQKGLSVDDLACLRPLALETLAGNLEKHEARICDYRFENDFPAILADFMPDIIALTALTTTVYSALYLLKTAKEFLPNCITLVGGQHASLSPSDFCHSFVDLILLGEGERILQRVADTLEMSGHRSAAFEQLRKIPGVAIPSNNKLILDSYELIDDLDATALPKKGLTKKYQNNYLWIDAKKSLTLIQTSRGCPYQCSFCAENRLNKGKYRAKTPARILEEITAVVEDVLYIVDNNFFESEKRLNELYFLMKENAAARMFFVMGRADSIARHPQLIERLREVGLCGVLVGFEDLRNEELQKLGTRKSNRVYHEAIKILNQNELFAIGSFIINPDFSSDDFDYFEDFILPLDIAHYDLQILTPFPGTRLYEEKQHQLLSRDLRLFDAFHLLLPARMGKDRFYERYIDLYLKTWKRAKDKAFFQDMNNRWNYIPIWKTVQNYRALLNLPEDEKFLRDSEPLEEYIPARTGQPHAT